MRLRIREHEVVLALSRKNLAALLDMLNDPGDKSVPALSARDGNREILVVPEEDEIHYVDRPAGLMSWEVRQPSCGACNDLSHGTPCHACGV